MSLNTPRGGPLFEVICWYSKPRLVCARACVFLGGFGCVMAGGAGRCDGCAHQRRSLGAVQPLRREEPNRMARKSAQGAQALVGGMAIAVGHFAPSFSAGLLSHSFSSGLVYC